jgi:hypothetical protein
MTDAIDYRFDCQALPVGTAAALQQSAERIRCLGTTQTETIIEIGRELIAAKGRLEHGQFTSWIDAEFRMSIRTAQNYMAVTERLAERNAIISFLEPTALYALAAPSTPLSVHEDVTTRITRGEPVTTKFVKELVSIARIETNRADREANRRRWKRVQRTRERDPKWMAPQAKQQAREKARQREESRKRQLCAEEIIDILRKRLGPYFGRFVDLFSGFGWGEFRELQSRLQRDDAAPAVLAEIPAWCRAPAC